MIKSITGVLADGTNPSNGQAALTPYPQGLTTPLGEDGTVLLTVLHADRTPVDLTGGTLFLTVRRRSTDHDPCIVRQGTLIAPTSGQAAFALLAGDTLYEPIGTYRFDVFFNDRVGLRWQIVPTSAFHIQEAVGRPGEPVSIPGIEPPLQPGDDGILAITSEGSKAVIGQNEDLVDQRSFDFDLLTSANIYCELSGLTEQTNAATGTYRVRIGGTANQTDGAEVVNLQTAHLSAAIPPDYVISAAFPRPSGPQLVKLTARASLPGAHARIRSYQIAFKTVTP
jgi:hypothetical protein